MNDKMLTSGKPIIDGDTDSIYTVKADDNDVGRVVAYHEKKY